MNLKDIASRANVSTSTVSRYLNNGQVSASAKERIKKVIEETNYQPSKFATSLRTKKTMQIGVIIPKLDSASISRMVSGISNVLIEKDYNLILTNVENKEEDEIKYLNILNNKLVDGIILVGTIFTEKHKEVISTLEIPIVVLAQKVEDIPCVYYDNYESSLDITNVIIKNKKNPAIIHTRLDDIATGRNRYDGFVEALSNNNITNFNSIESKFTFEDGYEKCKKLFEIDDTIDSLFCATDNIAMGAITYLKEIDKKIPDDVSIGSIGGSFITKLVQPNITSIDFEYYTSGQNAANILLNKLDGNKTIDNVKTKYTLNKTNSTL